MSSRAVYLTRYTVAGRGWREALSTRAELMERAPHPKFATRELLLKSAMALSGSGLDLRAFQRRDGLADVGIEAGAAGIEMGEDRAEHAWVPEFLDVLGDAGDRLAVALALEKLADLVGHVDQPVRRRHKRSPWCARERRSVPDG